MMIGLLTFVLGLGISQIKQISAVNSNFKFRDESGELSNLLLIASYYAKMKKLS